jgi:hypothetical protein
MPKTKEASLPKLARTNTEQIKSYRKGDNQSSYLKGKIGEIMLCLVAGDTQPDTLQLFDRILRQLYEGGTI